MSVKYSVNQQKLSRNYGTAKCWYSSKIFYHLIVYLSNADIFGGNIIQRQKIKLIGR